MDGSLAWKVIPLLKGHAFIANVLLNGIISGATACPFQRPKQHHASQSSFAYVAKRIQPCHDYYVKLRETTIGKTSRCEAEMDGHCDTAKLCHLLHWNPLCSD